MNVLALIILANGFLSLVSAVGIWTIAHINRRSLHSPNLKAFISLSAGTLLGGAFLHLLPEASEAVEGIQPFLLTLLAFLGFFVIEKIIHWRHCHTDSCPEHSVGYVNLMGDGLHNFIDGVIIAGAFMTDVKIGIITTIAVALHEIPQEIGDMGVLLHAGFSRKTALLANVSISLTALLGGIFGYFFISLADTAVAYLLPLAAGNFLYLASSDLLPEIRKEDHKHRFGISMAFVMLGVAIMAVFTLLE
ncbi:ZIP family metal transporter [Candidatus Woesebacteria bacterium]|nr:ZIP family metal transporter [Candidatus Woesebacteria bacterium]